LQAYEYNQIYQLSLKKPADIVSSKLQTLTYQFASNYDISISTCQSV